MNLIKGIQKQKTAMVKSTGDRLVSNSNTELRANNWILQNVNVTNPYKVKIIERFFFNHDVGEWDREKVKLPHFPSSGNPLQWSKIKS